ncbi:MAG TPA: PPE domain-containing protein [Actinophytocola sp.]|uniref:PPE domain-containing protein n=1 Tax=Actinophytocola sp. TaxID=1872138 RepID=UPI002F92855C
MANRWRGYGHPELYSMINSGPGASASEPQIAYWKGLTEQLGQVDADLNHKLNSMGATWEGKAAESAQSGLTPLAEWATDAETGSTVMQTSSELQADYISDARANMPEPVKVTTPAPSGWQMATAAAGALTGNPGPALAVAAQAADHEAQEQAQNEAEQKAVRTMQNYESSSTWNRDTLGTFVAPPDVVVATPAPQGGTGGHVESANSQVGTNAHGTTQPTSTSHATIPTTNGTAGTGGTLVPTGGGTAQPPTTTVPTGGGVSAIPATTTPQSLLPPTGQPPIGQPPVQPGPSIPNPPVTPSNPALNNPLLPTFGNPGPTNPLTNGNTNPLTNGNRGPLVGRGPVPTNGIPGEPAPPVNAGDAARRALPLRGGLPAGGAGAVEPDLVRQGNPYGRGGVGGSVPGANAAVRSGPGAATAAGGRGAASGVRGPGGAGARGGVNGPMGAGGRRADDEDDEERYAPDYLLETEDVFGDDRRVVPGVIGETAPLE